MTRAKSGTTARAIADDVLGRTMTNEIWTGNYDRVLPLSVQDFDLTAVLPAMFYMFRFGHRRGKGRFLEVFGGNAGTPREKKRAATIDRIAESLAQTDTFAEFHGETERAILGDLLLSFCLENAKRALGRQEQVQRARAPHYMAAWLDLPERVANLRFVPEMLVAILADQKGERVEQSHDGDRTWFPVGHGVEDNVLLRVFYEGVVRQGPLGSLTADRFDEAISVGLDQLLMIRLAQQLGAAPGKVRGKTNGGDIVSNQRPIAERAAQHFSEDIRYFILGYAGAMPRHTFTEMLESCMAVGLTTTVTSVIELLFNWVQTGEICPPSEQRPASLFVDCSNGIDRRLRAVAEQSMDDAMRQVERLPVVLMALRLLDYGARFDPQLRKLNIPTLPYATEWVNLLGDLLHERREEAQHVMYDFERKAQELADAFEEEFPDAAELLRNDRTYANPAWRIAETLTALQGRHSTQGNIISLVDSSMLINRPNGLATKRSVVRTNASGGRKKRDVRSVVLTDTVLDQLVHLHVLRGINDGKYRPLAFTEFLQILRDRYGFCIDIAPAGLTTSNDLLQVNRRVLERRLRDLGLLVGVNDAESMKHLKPRFEPSRANSHELD